MATIVTGGAQGIGAAITIALLKKEYKVCVADILEVEGREFVADLQKTYGADKVIFSHCDVSKESDYARTFDVAVKVFGRVNVLINNAGIYLEQEHQKVIDVNLMGPIFGCQAALKYMGKSNGGKGGMVINTSSLAGLAGLCRSPIYSASKHGVIGLTRSYGQSYIKDKEELLFAALCPSYTNTNILKHTGIVHSHRAMMSPEYVAEGVVKLLTDRINGSALMVTKKHGYQYFEFPDIDEGV